MDGLLSADEDQWAASFQEAALFISADKPSASQHHVSECTF
jgi:hypothetical protein